MIDSEKFYCEKCKTDHSVFYSTMVSGADLPTGIEIEEKPLDSIILTKEYAYVLGEIDLWINDREKNVSFRNWVRILRIEWKEYIEESRKGIHKTISCELLNEIILYPKIKRLSLKLGFDDESQIFKFILEGKDELATDNKNGLTFFKYTKLMAYYIHSLNLEIEDTTEYNSNTFDQLLNDFNSNVEGQYIHARYEDEIIFQMISICSTDLYQNENNCDEICIDIPVNEFVEELMTTNSIKFFNDQEYVENTFDGIKIYQKNVGVDKANIESNIKELLTVVYDVNYTDIVYTLETMKELKN